MPRGGTNMTFTVVTTKGRVVIPSKIRRYFNIKQGTRLFVMEQDNQIVLQPLTEDYFDKMAGILKTKGKLTKALLDERTQDKEI
jgi:AbrB family looped-hinge helix DNA binding protein